MPDEDDRILVELAQHGIVLTPRPAPSAPEPGDQHLWELLAAREDLLPITGDKLSQQDVAMVTRIVSPATFVERWSPRDR